LRQRISVIKRITAAKNVEKAQVELMTIHASKGREYDQVWLIGLCDENIPDPKRKNSDAVSESMRLEEERRILYVGITRAKNQLRLTWSRRVDYYPKAIERSLCRFLNHLPTRSILPTYFNNAKYIDRFTM
jgi:ATP-dependent DNA helicase Rep